MTTVAIGLHLYLQIGINIDIAFLRWGLSTI